jgi:ribosomal protein L11 methyltransferase
VPQAEAEELRGRFVELAPEGFEESEQAGTVELAAYGEAADRVLAAFPDAALTEIAKGWEDRWREFHRPVRIGSLWVGPPWETPDPDALAIVIDPARAFGTGAHPTTRLCLELLLEEKPGSVLDLGCGSGVIAIAAARLGFRPVCAIDHDDAAIDATSANARANGVTIESRQADALTAELPERDLVLVNIALDVVGELVPRLVAPRLICAGYLASDRFEPTGYEHLERRTLDGWAADLFRRR